MLRPLTEADNSFIAAVCTSFIRNTSYTRVVTAEHTVYWNWNL